MRNPGEIASRVLGNAPKSATLVCEASAAKIFQIDRGGALFRRNPLYDYLRHVLIHIILNDRTQNVFLCADDGYESPPRIQQVNEGLWRIGADYCCLDTDLESCLYCGNWALYHGPNPLDRDDFPRFEDSPGRSLAEFLIKRQVDLYVCAGPDEDTLWVVASTGGN